MLFFLQHTPELLRILLHASSVTARLLSLAVLILSLAPLGSLYVLFFRVGNNNIIADDYYGSFRIDSDLATMFLNPNSTMEELWNALIYANAHNNHHANNKGSAATSEFLVVPIGTTTTAMRHMPLILPWLLSFVLGVVVPCALSIFTYLRRRRQQVQRRRPHQLRRTRKEYEQRILKMITKKLAPYTKTLEHSDCIQVTESMDPTTTTLIKQNEGKDRDNKNQEEQKPISNCSDNHTEPDRDTIQQSQFWRIPAPGTTHNKFQSNHHHPSMDGKGNYYRIHQSFTRVVTPGNCAICLHGFEVSHTISWSSNPACVHCFHEDCIQSWLWNCYIKRLVTDEDLDGYHDDRGSTKYPCPCCRQEFIMPTSKFNC